MPLLLRSYASAVSMTPKPGPPHCGWSPTPAASFSASRLPRSTTRSFRFLELASWVVSQVDARPGPVQARHRLGLGSAQARSRLSPGPVQAWPRPGPGLVLARSGLRTSPPRSWERHAPPWGRRKETRRAGVGRGPLGTRCPPHGHCRWPFAGACWWVAWVPGSGDATGQHRAHVGRRGPGRGGARGARWPRALTPVMNLDDIQLPLLLNSLAALALAETSGGSPAGRVTRCRGGPDNRLGRRRPRTPAAPGPASAGLRPPGAPAGAPTSRTAAGPVFGAPRAGWSGDRACFRAHLPANALTLSAPIIIQSALRRAAIP